MKSTKKNYHLKYKDKVVDAASNNEFIFNKTPILVPMLQSKTDQNKIEKRPRSKNAQIQEIDEPVKKNKRTDDITTALENAVYTPMESDLFSYFKSTKTSSKTVESIPKPKYEVGSMALTAICDRGIGGKYLVTNFSRNCKGYIDYKELNFSHNPEAISHYTHPGEFLVAQVVKGENPKHIQLSLNLLNNNLNEKQIRVGQVVMGQIKSKEEIGCHIRVSKTASFKYFLPKQAIEEAIFDSLVEQKVYLLWVSAVDFDRKFVTLSLSDTLFNLRGIEQEQLCKYDLEPYIMPGHRVNTMVLKKLKNGLLVKFLKIFYGYIFIDHLIKHIDDYKVGDKFECRIIHLSMNPPTVFLSQKHAQLKVYKPKQQLYTALKIPEDLYEQEGVFLSSSKEIMLHPLQMHSNIENIEKLYVKEYNFFEGYQICSSRKLGLRVGEVSRVIPFQNFKVFGKGTGKFRVMCLDVWNKVIKASYDPLVLSEKDKQLVSIGDIDPNKQYVGFISTTSSNGIIVEFQNNIKGLVNSHEVKLNGGDISSYQQGQGILVYVRTAKEGLLELALSLTKKEKRKRKQSSTNEEDGEKFATICSVNSKSIQPVYVRINKKLIALSIFKHICTPEQLATVLPLDEHFHVGDRVKIYIKDNEYYLYPPEQLTNPQLKICRVVGQKSPIVRLQYDKDGFGSCHITQVTDMLLPNPVQTELEMGEYRVGRIISEGWLSLRESIVKNGIPSDMKECVSRYSEAEKNGDYRSRLLLMPNGGGLKVGMLFFGYVKSISDKGCFIVLGNHYDIRVEISELSDDRVVDMHKQFYENKLVFGRLIAEKHKPNDPNLKLFDGSLRESVVKYGYQLNFDTLKVGLTVEGKVTGYTKGNALISLDGCKYRGIMSLQNYNNSEESLQKVLPLGFRLTCKVIAFETEPKLLIKLSGLEKHFKMYPNESALHNDDAERTGHLLQSIRDLNAKYEQHLNQITEDREFQPQQEEMDEQAQYERIRKMLQEKGLDQESEQMEVEQPEEEELQEDNGDVQSDIESESQQEADNQNENVISNKLDEYVDKMEKLPHPSSHYQSLVLSAPTVESHLKYISSLLQEKRPEQIRHQFVRAISNLKTIKDKENMWIAWLNIETILGGFEQTVKKAIEGGASEKVYFRIIDILVEQSKWDVAIEFTRAMVKKFSTNMQCWQHFLKVVILFRKQHNLPKTLEPKQVMKRAQQVMDNKQIILLQTHYGTLQYHIGEAELARGVFESLLSRYPKRTDLWSVYVDMEVKYGDTTRVPTLFQRQLSLALKPKKMKFIFKKYIKFAEDHLTEKDVQEVLKKATAYAANNIEGEGDSENDSD